ncbi:hypothetical protein [Oceanimonas baumannii]|uniref:Uncharacterized protein n=1 Tax=Oceanimonas baumannii TaxID=129578 RepID=A0A235CKY6_9GAMM|nr:hypothetical protein [Oceanimonas baumannii]OYD25089.1 hypothetical protein B6S09_07820 [Oceanimonas baumannii]TDW59870.1 hypothetical protein LY04_01513 [Oceanimonas baumannii]
MAKVTTVMLQGISYHWNGEDILVDDGISLPWSLAGSALEQIELYNDEGDSSGSFSIDFEQQNWLLQGDSAPGDVILLDDNGAALAALSSFLSSELTAGVQHLPDNHPLPVNIDDILLGSDVAELYPVATIADTPALDTELIDDVINWLSVYSPPE